MLLLLYKPKDNIADHRDLLVSSFDVENYLHDFPGSICVSHSSIVDSNDSFSTRCRNRMFGYYKMRGWSVPKNNSNFIILKRETINI